MPIIALTDLTVRSLKPGLYLDRTTKAFGIRVGKHRKTWIVLKEPNRTKVKLGAYPALSLSEARKRALIALGSPYKAPTAPTFPEALGKFLALDRWKPNSKYQLTRNIKRFFNWTKALDKITVPAEKSSAGILMVEATEEWPPSDASFVLDWPREREELGSNPL